VSRVPYADLIAFVVLVAAAVVLFVASLSWAWVGDTLAGLTLVLFAVRRLRGRRRTA
jgi:hypothetical protein